MIIGAGLAINKVAKEYCVCYQFEYRFVLKQVDPQSSENVPQLNRCLYGQTDQPIHQGDADASKKNTA